jgi:hypothetical protein
MLVDSGDEADYLKPADGLTVQLGMFSSGVAGGTEGVMSYVFRNPKVDCGPPAGPPRSSAPGPTDYGTCTALVIANANTGAFERLVTYPAESSGASSPQAESSP